MDVRELRIKTRWSFILLILSSLLLVFSTYAYFTNQWEESFSGQMGIVDVNLNAYFEVASNSQNSQTSSDVSFTAATHTITSVSTDLSVYSDGDTIRVDGSTNNDHYFTVSGSPTANNLVVVENLTDESSGAYVTIDKVTLSQVQANEVVIDSSNSYTATDIAFTSASKTISSTSTDLSVYSDGDTIRIQNSSLNDGHYTVSGNPTATSLVVIEDLVDEGALANITIDKVITKPGVYYVNIVSAGNDSYFEDFRLIIDVYSSVDTYLRVKIYEQLTLTYVDYQGDETELSILFDGYMPFKYNTTNWYDNRNSDNYLYYKNATQRINESTPTEIPLIEDYFSGQNYSTYPVGYSLQIAFSIEAVQAVQGPEQVWGLATKPWGGDW